MLKFLTRFRADTAANETDREQFVRALKDLNDVLSRLPNRPDITVSGASGIITIDTPDQFPDEALALPKPDAPEVNGHKTPESLAA